ncbi:MAG: FHA domain-containing protein [Planctomycetota bacterium]
MLGRTPGELWRHVPYQASEPGQGQDPGLEPRVEVIRRLIAYPPRSFARVVDAVAGLDSAERPVRWTCYRDPGVVPARPYWLCFLSATPHGRRFHFGLELFDRERLGLWFFSGYDADTAPPELLAPFPARPEVSLPRVELADDHEGPPLEEWLRAAWEDRLRFGAAAAARRPPTDQSLLLSDSLARVFVGGAPAEHLSLRASRARLVVGLPEGARQATLHPLARLSTLVGRDPRCDLVIEHPTISSEHCRIVWRNGLPGVEECGSKNGTRLDGEEVVAGKPRAIEGPEARLTLGEVECLLIRDPDPGAAGDGRLERLAAKGTVQPDALERARGEAARLGITPPEVLLRDGGLTLAQWRPPKGGSCLLFLLLLPLLLLSGCAHSLAFLPPVVEWELEPQPMREGTRAVDWDYDVGIKPLFQARKKAEDDRREVHAVFPLGLMESNAQQRITRLYPVFQRYERTDPDGFPDTDTILFPFVFTGSHPVDGGYFYLFPFGGLLRGLLGKDEAIGVLFPLYGWARDGETQSHHVLWPLFCTTSGGGHSGWRLLPFYGHFTKTRDDGQVVFDRTTVMWPFFHMAHDATNSRNAFTSLFLFPFYGRTRSGWIDDDVILWPLFRWWTDKRSGYSEVRAPFPFFIYGSGPDHFRLDFWPFYGYRKRGDYTRHLWLWPVGRSERQETDEYDDYRFWLLPLLWFHSRKYKVPVAAKGHEDSDFEAHVWPLLHWSRRHDGFFTLSFPAPLWFKDPLWNFDTILAPLWRLFHYQRDTRGYERLDLLLGLYSERWAPSGEHRWDILGGLVGRTTKGEESKVRLLWFLEF